MPSPISIRDTDYWKKVIDARSWIILDRNADFNSELIDQVIKIAKPALPHFDLEDNGVNYIARSVSYLLRPDIVKVADEVYGRKMMMQDLDKIDLRTRVLQKMEDPALIVPGFRLADTPHFNELRPAAQEWFRCYSASIEGAKLTNRLTKDGSAFTPSYVLADVTTFMLNPFQLMDAVYTISDHEVYARRVENAVQ